eukprot:gene7838-10645_t
MGGTNSTQSKIEIESSQPHQQSSSGCPVKAKPHTSSINDSKSGGCPIKSKPQIAVVESIQSTNKSECPMNSSNQTYKNPNIYNVYGEIINPDNKMPNDANQKPSPTQTQPLDTTRVPSSIPKGGTDDQTWVYPSSQMFWNALARKNKLEGVSEKDVDTVISIHNNMNENTWEQVLAWEKLNPRVKGREAKLLRFTGRPDELSPKARLKMFFGHPAPFDRHDWIVDRGGNEVRYIIDYYHDESMIEFDKTPKHLKDISSMKSIQVDVRPAIQSFKSILDRMIFMPLLMYNGKTTFNPPSFFPPSAMVIAEKRKINELSNHWSMIQTKCLQDKEKLTNANNNEKLTDEQRGALAVSLQRCTASVVCPSIVEEFDRCVSAKPNDNSKTTTAYDGMLKCLDTFHIDSVRFLNAKGTKN